ELLKKLLGVTSRNGKIRAAKSIENCEINSDYFAVMIEERTAGTARSCCSIVNNFVLQYVANMPLRGGRANQFFSGKFGNDLGHVCGVSRNAFRNIRSRASQNSFDAGWISDQNYRLSRHGRVSTVV